MTKQMTAVLVIVGALLCVAGAGILIWKLSDRQPFNNSGGNLNERASDVDKQQNWHTVEVAVDGQTGIFEVGVFRQPVPFKPLPLDQTRRDTPLASWISLKSHAVAGKDTGDLDRYAAHFLDRDYLLNFVRDQVQLPSEEYFQRLRNAEANSRAVGTVKYGNYTLLIYKFQGSGKLSDRTYTVSACMIKKDGIYYIDERPKDTDPVLKEAVDTGFKRWPFFTFAGRIPVIAA
jgi:hypothetical protein